MADATLTTLLNHLLDPVTQALTPEAARRLVELRADEAAQARIEELADKCTAGTLSSEEQSEYESLVNAAAMIAVLQAKAREFLARNSAA